MIEWLLRLLESVGLRKSPMRIRTYLDTSVLIHALRGPTAERRKARQIISDPSRILISSEFVRYEVMPAARRKALRGDPAQLNFFSGIFNMVGEWVPCDDSIVRRAADLSTNHHRLLGLDAMHAAAAAEAKVDQFITDESVKKDFHLVAEINPVHMMNV